MKSLVKVLTLLLIIITFTYGGLYVLKIFGVTGGVATRLVPFICMVLVTLFFSKVIDHNNLADVGLGLTPQSGSRMVMWKFNVTLFLLALVPVLIGILLNKRLIILQNK